MSDYYIIKTTKHVTEHVKHEVEHDEHACDYEQNKDWEFMKHCNEVDENRPATWSKYPMTITGANDIIKMEFDELMKDAKEGNMKDWETNLYHLSVATLNAWRILNNEKRL